MGIGIVTDVVIGIGIGISIGIGNVTITVACILVREAVSERVS